MIGLDTNVLVRYVMQDDVRQAARATALIDSFSADIVAQALKRYATGGADFADALIERIATAAGCGVTMTFDAGTAKAAGMTVVP